MTLDQFATALDANSRFVKTHLEFKYYSKSDDSDSEAEDNVPEDAVELVADAADAFRPLQTVYAKAFREIEYEGRGLVEIEHEMEPIFKLSLVHKTVKGKKKPEFSILADLEPYADSEDSDYFFDPDTAFTVAKLEDL